MRTWSKAGIAAWVVNAHFIKHVPGRKTDMSDSQWLAHKMIRLIYVLLTRSHAYRDRQIDYAAMSAKKNAPRWIKQLKLIGKWPAPTSAPTTASA